MNRVSDTRRKRYDVIERKVKSIWNLSYRSEDMQDMYCISKLQNARAYLDMIIGRAKGD